LADFEHQFGAIYDELRTLARRQVARLSPGQTLSPTALVHEAYMKLADASGGSLRDEQHFRALAARAMRQVIIDYLRRRHASKRDPGLPHTTLSGVAIACETSSDDVLALDEALNELEALDERQARIVEMRFFAGLGVEEVAATLGISERTVKREWQKARAFLFATLRTSGHDTGTLETDLRHPRSNP
jgi:RNA polymerase sigma-70 factor (ECF subfamily)